MKKRLQESDLYYGDSTKIIHSGEPSADIDIDRLSNGDEPFIHTIPSNEGWQKATILLPEVNCWDIGFEERKKIKAKLAWLYFYGFDMFFHSKETAENWGFQQKAYPVSREELAKTINQPIDTIVQIPKDAFVDLMLSPFHMTENLPTQKGLRFDSHNMPLSILAQASKKHGANITELMLNGYDLTEEAIDYNCFQYLINVNDFHLHNSSDLTLQRLSKLPLHQVERLYIKTCTFDVNYLQDLLIKTNLGHLKELTLNHSFDSGQTHLAQLSLKQLKKLTLFDSHLRVESLQALLAEASQLQELEISHYAPLQLIHLANLPLKQLKKLTLYNANLTAESLHALLVEGNSLEKLRIYECHDLDTSHLTNLPLQQLKKLEIIFNNLSAQSLQALLAQANQLEELEIIGCTNLNAFHLANLPLHQLKKLKISNANLSAQSVHALLAQANQLEELEIIGCTNLDAFHLANLPLLQLKKLKISSANLSAQSVHALLAQARQLKELVINGCKNLQSSTHLDNVPMEQLGKLIIDNSNLSGEFLQALLAGATQLEELQIISCKNLKSSHLANLPLKKLNGINITKSNLSIQSLQALLAEAIKLETLIIGSCKKLGSAHLTTVSCNNLKTLCLYKTNLSLESVQTLLVQTSQLDQIRIQQQFNFHSRSKSSLKQKTVNLFHSKLEHLTKLSLKQLKWITLNSDLKLESMQALLAQSEQLQTVRIEYCNNIDSDMAEILKNDLLSRYPNLNFLYDPYLPQLDSSYVESDDDESESFEAAASSKTAASSSSATKKPSSFSGSSFHDLPAPSFLDFFQRNHFISLDTRTDKKTYHLQRQFIGKPYTPHITTIREQAYVFDERSSLILKELPIPEAVSDGREIPRVDKNLLDRFKQTPVPPERNAYFGQLELFITTRWTRLPSAHADETVHAFYANTDLPIEMRSYKGWTYMRNREPNVQGLISLEILSDAPLRPTKTLNDLPEEVRQAVLECRGYHNHHIEVQNLEELMQHRIGRCELRVAAFNELTKGLPIQKYAVTNRAHAIVDVWHEGQRVSCDLGGYNANLNIEENIHFEEAELTIQEPPVRAEELSTLEISRRGEVREPEFFAKIADLSKLTLHDDIRIPHETKLEHLDTLTLVNCEFDSSTLNNLLIRLPNLKTLVIKHPRITTEVFAAINLASLPKLEWVEFVGDFMSDHANVKRVMDTSPNVNKIRWVIESAELNALPNVQQSKPLLIEYKATKRLLPEGRYQPTESAPLGIQERLWSGEWFQAKQRTLLETVDPIATSYVLEQYCKKTQKPFFRITHPNQLKCQRRFIAQQTNGTGRMMQGPGGALYDFIKAHPYGILLIDYTEFKPSDIAQFNSLYDDKPRLDGIDIPHLAIFGIIDPNNPESYDGADFYSRFERAATYTAPILPLLYQYTIDNVSEEDEIIELAGIASPRSYLLGHWTLGANKNLIPAGRELTKALATGKRIVINNPPLEDPDFIRLVHDFIADHPEGPTLYFHQGIDLKPLKDQLTFDPNETLPQDAFLLNEATFKNFIPHYEIESDDIKLEPGYFKTASTDTLTVLLTATLSTTKWLQLLSAAKKAHKKLKLYMAPTVILPSELSFPEECQKQQWPSHQHSEWVVNTPADLPKDAIIIEIDELKQADLFATTTAVWSEELESLQFGKKEGFVEKQLNEGKTIILKGHWPHALKQQTEDFLVKRIKAKPDTVKGRLILIGENENSFTCTPASSKHPVKENSVPIIQTVVYENRYDALETALKTHPLACLIGPTGCGKTQFMKTLWQAKHRCFYGEEAIVPWLESLVNSDKPGELITLFIDETNLTKSDWSLLAGLYNQPPRIFYKGTYYPVSDKHCVVIASNPTYYSTERREIGLLKDYPYTELGFQALPLSLGLANLVVDSEIEKNIREVIADLEKTYPHQLIITPREIAMMALEASALSKKHPDQSIPKIIDNLMRQLVMPHLPTANKQQMEKIKPPLLLPSEQVMNFIMTATMEPVLAALHGHLCLRDARIQNTISLTGGLGGISIEGPPGMGKTELVLEYLAINHLLEHIDYFHIPASLDYGKKCEILLTAFHEGKIIVIDEINSSPMMERILNALLEGHDLEDRPAAKPGFLLIGTQNPAADLRGRREIPLPLQHRMQMIELSSYSSAEMMHIVTKKYQLPNKIASDMISEYELQKGKNSKLCFRDLQRWAKHWQETHSKHTANIGELKKIHPQKGSFCKVTALANVEEYFAGHCGYETLPMHKLKKHSHSLRELAKTQGSQQGELLEWSRWELLTNTLGYHSKTVAFGTDFNSFLNAIVDALQKGNLPLIAFAVDKDSGQPDPLPTKPEEQEHASVITAYNPKADQFTLKHWGCTYQVDAVTLFRSNQALLETRKEEHYQHNPEYKGQFHKTKYLPVKKAGAQVKTSIIPVLNSGFQAKLLIIESPQNYLQDFANQREKLMTTGFNPGLFADSARDVSIHHKFGTSVKSQI
jgi:hypothetical protein